MLLQISNILYCIVLLFFCIIPKNSKTLQHENTKTHVVCNRPYAHFQRKLTFFFIGQLHEDAPTEGQPGYLTIVLS